MDTLELKRRLRELSMGVVEYHNSIGSTNDRAAELYNQGAPHFSLVVADEQTEGRGRSGRSWFTPPGAALAFSLVLRPDGLQDEAVLRCTGLGALAVCQSIQDIYTIPAMIKWPNDVLLSRKKVCGILVESEVKEGAAAYAVIGIGLNVNLSFSGHPEIEAIATSLSAELGRDVPTAELVRILLTEMERLYVVLPAGEAIYAAWRDSLVTLGKEVSVESGGATQVGIAQSVDRDGSLLLRLPDGSLSRIVAGEVTLRHQTE